MNQGKVDISVIILNYNSVEHLTDCLLSLRSMEFRGLREIIVVDNASIDHDYISLREEFPEIKWVQNEKNYGFARACNKGARRAQGRYVIFLNVDTKVSVNALQIMYNFMEDHKDIGVCGPQFRDETGRKRNSIDNIPSWWTLLVNKSLLRIFFPLKFPSKYRQANTPLDVESLVGACFFVRASVFRNLKGFDESYFFYMEETDLCSRMKREGFRVVWLPEAEVMHLSGASTRQTPIASRIEYHKSLYVFLKRRGFQHQVLFNLKVCLCVRYFINMCFSVYSWRRLKTYACLLLWHVRGCPIYDGLEYVVPKSHRTIRKHSWLIRSTTLFSPNFLNLIKEGLYDDTIITGRVLKDSSYRTVLKKKYRYQDRSLNVVVKICRNTTWKEKIKTLLLSSKAKKEWNRSLWLIRRNIMTPKPIICAERRCWGILRESIYVSEYIEDSQELLSFKKVFPAKSLWEKRELIETFARFVASLHRVGFYHKDFHSGNILIRYDQGQTVYYVIDLHRSRIVGHLSMRQRLIDFAYLRGSLIEEVGGRHGLRFLKAYDALNPQLPFSYRFYLHYLIETMERVTRKTKPVFWYFWRWKSPFYRTSRGEWLKGQDKVFWGLPNMMRNTDFVRPEHIIKQGRKYRVFYSYAFNGVICCKQAVAFSWLRIGRLYREWLLSVRLFYRGISIPRPLAYLYRQGIYVSHYVSPSWSADAYFYEQIESLSDKRHFIRGLAQFVRNIHLSGIYHRDLKGANILVQPIGSHRWKFYLVDNDRVNFCKELSSKKVCHNIAQIWASLVQDLVLKDQILFLNEYGRDHPFLREIVLNGLDEIKAMKDKRVFQAGLKL
jgi:GT2 family glycosyltransferase/serine/threonine protein kinase